MPLDNSIRTIIVIPSVCGLEDNYNYFLRDILSSEYIIGVCEVSIPLKRNLGLALMYLRGRAWRLAMHLLVNTLFFPTYHRKKLVKAHNKNFFQVQDINGEYFYKIIEQFDINLLVHSRTRRRFLPETLEKIKYGCINIHNGILPWQRGIKSDLRAFAKGQETGFSFHFMEDKIDCGPIISSVTIENNYSKNYDEFTNQATRLHAEQLLNILNILQTQGSINSIPQDSIPGDRIRYSLLSIEELKQLHLNGIVI